jgi:hypothetical protein
MQRTFANFVQLVLFGVKLLVQQLQSSALSAVQRGFVKHPILLYKRQWGGQLCRADQNIKDHEM